MTLTKSSALGMHETDAFLVGCSHTMFSQILIMRECHFNCLGKRRYILRKPCDVTLTLELLLNDLWVYKISNTWLVVMWHSHRQGSGSKVSIRAKGEGSQVTSVTSSAFTATIVKTATQLKSRYLLGCRLYLKIVAHFTADNNIQYPVKTRA